MSATARADRRPLRYEARPGAASKPLPARYHRHEPEKTPLYRVVQENLETLLEEMSRASAGRSPGGPASRRPAARGRRSGRSGAGGRGRAPARLRSAAADAAPRGWLGAPRPAGPAGPAVGAGRRLLSARGLSRWPPRTARAWSGLCRYTLRSSFSLQRLSVRSDGKVCYRLKRPWPTAGGATELVLDPLDFLRRLARLIPAPRVNLVRYGGAFSPNSALRDRIIPRLPKPRVTCGHATSAGGFV